MNRHPLAVVSALAALALSVVALPAPAVAAEPAAAPHASLDPRLKLKDGDRYLRDLSAELHIPREEICKELSQYDCFRDATPAETAQLLGFYQKVSASASPADTKVKDWVTLGCFAVASSVENIFY